MSLLRSVLLVIQVLLSYAAAGASPRLIAGRRRWPPLRPT